MPHPSFRRQLVLATIAASILAPLPAPLATHAATLGPNLITNPGLETQDSSGVPEGWAKGQWGVNTAVFAYPVSGVSGRGVEVQLTARTSGDAKWYPREVAVTPGRSYQFTDRYQATVPTTVTVQEHASGSLRYVDVLTLPATSSWQLAQVAYLAPADVVGITVFHLINQVGTLRVDEFELHEVIDTTDELIANPSLEQADGAGQPVGWAKGRWGTNTAVFTYPVAGVDGARAAKVELTAYTNGDAKWYFADVAVEPNAAYTLSNRSHATIPSFITARYRDTSGAYRYVDLGRLDASTTWQPFTATFTPPAGTVAVTVFHLIKGVGSLTVDDYHLRRSSAPDPAKFAEGMVSLNFDDGFKSAKASGLPILNNRGLKSTQYIVTGYLNFPAYVTADEVRQMQAQGHEIGAHTRTHRDLTQLSEDEARGEIIGSRQDLLDLGVPRVDTFAYPFGAYNATTDGIVRSAGFTATRTTNGGFNLRTDDPYLLRRQDVSVGTTVDQVKAWIDTAVRERTWLILVFHKVDDSGRAQTISPERLRQIANYLVSQQVKVVTTAEGRQLMQ